MPGRFASAAPLKARIDVLAVGADSAGPQLQVMFGIPGNALSPVRLPGGFGYPLRLRVSVLALDGTVVATVDTSPSPGRCGTRSGARIPAQASSHPGAAGCVHGTRLAGNGGERRPRFASGYGQGGFTTWAPRLGSRIWPWAAAACTSSGRPRAAIPRGSIPLESFHAREPLQLFFEVAGLPPRSPYHVDLEIRRPAGGSLLSRLPLIGRRRTFFRLSFNAETRSSFDQVHQEIRLDQLPPGGYTLVVTVSSESGGKVTRQRELTVIK